MKKNKKLIVKCVAIFILAILMLIAGMIGCIVAQISLSTATMTTMMGTLFSIFME